MVLAWVEDLVNNDILETQFITDFREDVYEDSEDTVTDTQIQSWIRRGLKDISKNTGLNPAYCETVCDGSEYYELPTGLIKVGMIEYIESSTSSYIGKANLQKVNGLIGTAGVPTFYIVQGKRIFLYTQPASGTLRINATRKPKLSADNGGFIDLPIVYVDLLTMYCEYMYWKRRREMEEMTFASRAYYGAIKEADFQVQKTYGKGVKMYGKPNNNNTRNR